MLRLTIHRAAPGMVLAAPVLHPEKPEHVLLRPGAVLDSPTIDRLIGLNIRNICIEYPPTAYLMRYVSPAIIAEQGRLASRIGDCIDMVARGIDADFEFLDYLTGIRSLMQRLVNDPAAAMFIEDIADAPEPLVGHSFNVGMLSLLMGLRLDGYMVASRRRVHIRRAQNVENLCVGGLLHDLGMLRLDRDTLQRYYKTGDETDAAWRRHVQEGYRLVRGRIAPTAAAAVLHHHQRLDRSGFPARERPSGYSSPLAGREIHIFTRIIAVADTFDRLRRPPAGAGMSVPAVRALFRTLEHVRAGKLDPVAFRALLTVVPAFAPGSIVRLNDGRTYAVAKWDPSQPCRPTVVEVHEEGLGLNLRGVEPGPSVNLRERRDLWITMSEGQDVSRDLFNDLTAGEFDLRTPFPHGLVEPIPDQVRRNTFGEEEFRRAG